MITNSGVLPFLPAVKWFHHRREFSFGNVFPLVAPLGRIPPFQFSRALDETGIGNITLIRYADGQEYSVQVAMLLTGLTGATYPTSGNEIGYEHTLYPGSVALPVSGLTEGIHYLRFEDSMGEFFLSELFTWTQGLENRRDYVKVEWWHNEAVTFSGGRIQYDFPYKNWVWLHTDIGKPDYQVTERVVNRDGIDFPLQTISYKVHKFQFHATEYLLDSMYLIRAHDHKEVTHMGNVIGAGDFDKIFSFLLTPEWREQGNVASVEVEFRSNRVVVVNGRSYTDLDYEAGEGECFAANYLAVALILEDSPQYVGRYWTNEFGVDEGTIETGDYVLVKKLIDDTVDLMQYNGTTYVNIFPANFTTAQTIRRSIPGELERRDSYFFQLAGNFRETPIVLSESNVGSIYTISGATFDNTLIEVWLRTDDGDILAGTFLSDDFNDSGVGISFDAAGSNAYWVRARTYICDNLGESEVTTFEGIDWWEIENDFVVQGDPDAPSPDDPVDDG